MFIKQYIDSIREISYDKGIQSDDSRLRNRSVYNQMVTVRADLLAKKANKSQTLSMQNYQTVSFKLELTPSPVDYITSQVYRTETLPNIIYSMDNPLIHSITNIDVNNPVQFSRIDVKSLKYSKSNKFTSNTIKYFLFKNRIYFINAQCKLTDVEFTGVFDEVVFNEDCKSYFNYDFYLQTDLSQPLIQICSELIYKSFNSLTADNNNNALDDKYTNTKQ
jgi:hypothetical protein